MSWRIADALPFKLLRGRKRVHAARYLEIDVAKMRVAMMADLAAFGFAVVWLEMQGSHEVWHCAVVLGDVERRTKWRQLHTAQRIAYEQVCRALRRAGLSVWA